MVQRDVALGAAGAVVTSCAQHPRHRTQGRDMFGVVPFVEFVLVLARDIHPDHEQRRRTRGSYAVAGKLLLALVAQDALAELRSAFGPGGPVVATDREVG